MIFDIILHFDKYLGTFTQEYGNLTLAILFIIIFFETGVVVTPFLPGDSLIFAAGSLSALGVLPFFPLFITLISAAILGDTANYFVGRRFGQFLTNSKKFKFISDSHLEKTHAYFERYGSTTIIIARFVPIIRTFAPFTAGIGKMRFLNFAMYNVSGAILWVSLFSIAGFLFGNIPVIKNNFSAVILIIVSVSVLPVVYVFIKNKIRGG